jgi:hypothetical protein
MGDTTISSSTKPRDWGDYPTSDSGSQTTSMATGTLLTPRDNYSYEDFKRERSTNVAQDGLKVVGQCGVPALGLLDESGLVHFGHDLANGNSVHEAALKFVARKAAEEANLPAAKAIQATQVAIECDAALKSTAADGSDRIAHYLRNEANEIRQLKLDLDAGLISPAQYDRFTSKMSPASQSMAAGLKNKQFDEKEAVIASFALKEMKRDFAAGTAAAYKLELHSPADVKARCDKDPEFKKAYEGNYEFKVGVDKVVDDCTNDRKTYDANRPLPPASAQPAKKQP